MQIHIIAIGNRMPAWVNDGYFEYAKRLPPDYKIQLSEIPAQKRGKNANLDAIIKDESEKLIEACPKNSFKIALDRLGKAVSTMEISEKLLQFHDLGQDISLLIGGPEGIDPAVLAKVDALWSLSKLTLPHPLVRVLMAEQLYRAWSILASHPYHR